MSFKAREKQKHSEIEQRIGSFWQDDKTFYRSVDERPADKPFVFYDGPPFLTGTPHHGTLMISVVKDTVARYQTMQGSRVERRWGWDCHGLPAEVFVEKKLGIASKKEIGVTISIADYVKECRAVMVQNGTEWEDVIERVGRWVEFKGAYKTMDPEYMESVWWAFKELYEKGKIYEGEKILIYCTKDATPISKSEVAMENSYQEDTDPSVFVYFKLEESEEYLLVWTTTPWTLPANVAIAVNPEIDYSLVEIDGKRVYLATESVEKVLVNEKHQPLEYTVGKTIKGAELVGKKYDPLFENRGPESHVILAADFVTSEDGTGIVHQAPAYGEEDYELCKRAGIPLVSLVDENGFYTEGRWQGENIWEINKQIAKTLVAEGQALKVEYIKHDYPHCHRCGGKLMYRAHPSWFMDIQGQRQEMLDVVETTTWVPAKLRDGRFKNIIETAPDWNLSRDRYWATPIPVWRGMRNDGTEVVKVFGSYQEFTDFTGQNLNDYHLPNVMDVEFEMNGVVMRHIGKVLDCWFESGSMPFAQFHYPFENVDKFKSNFPADFICEAIDQTRGWFYNLTAVNVGLFGQSPFKNVICTGLINAADGRKISKKLGNYTDPTELMNNTSADAFRYTLLSSPVVLGEDINLGDKDVLGSERKLVMAYNVLDFFLMYAEVDKWQADESVPDPEHVLDKWILSKLQQLITDVTDNMNAYNLMHSSRPILEFLDDLSNWYVRRSRKRFWKSENDSDKTQAYHTLYYTLTQLSKVMAPFTPFMAEDIYQQLGHAGSVHLADWPIASQVDEQLVEQMSLVRELINTGLSQRAAAGVKVRQPLRMFEIRGKDADTLQGYEDILLEELNVKLVSFNTKTTQPDDPKNKLIGEIDLELDDELRREGTMREIVRFVQSARKAAELQVDDRIDLSLSSESSEINETIKQYSELISAETLALQITDEPNYVFTVTQKVDGHELVIGVQKA